MKPQIVVMKEPFDWSKIEYDLTTMPWNKPAKCPFSSSENDDGYYSEYIEWAIFSNFYDKDADYYMYRFDVSPGAKIFKIDSLDSINRLRFYSVYSKRFEGRLISFRGLLADGYCALHLTAAIHLDRSMLGVPMDEYIDLNAWDCESTAWLNTSYIYKPELIKVGKLDTFYKGDNPND